MKTKIFFVLIMLVMTSCAPLSKESYMEKYAKFMDEVSQNASTYTEKDWEKCDQRYQQYSDVWYQKFQKELTFSDKLTLAGYKIKYAYHRGLGKTGSLLMDAVNSVDVESAAACVKTYGKELIETVTQTDMGSLDSLIDRIDTVVSQIEEELEQADPESSR